MSVPLRNEQIHADDDTAELSTADIARGKRPGKIEEVRPNTSLSDTNREQTTADTSNSTPSASEKTDGDIAQLFPNEELQKLRGEWDGIQTAFVDEPRRAVEQADSLVASTMKRLAEVFANERSGLESQWDRGDNVSTEELRIALTRYRSFFHRLLAV